MDSHTEQQTHNTATPPKTDVVIGPSTPLPEKKSTLQPQFSSELPKAHAQLVMRGILAPALPHVQESGIATAESPQQFMESLRQAQELLQTNQAAPPQETTRLANFERLASVAFEELDPHDDEYAHKAQRQKLVLERMIRQAGFIPRSAFATIAQERMDRIMMMIEAKRNNNQLVQTDIDQANKQMATLTQFGSGALLMPEEIGRFIPMLQEQGIMLKLDSKTQSLINQLGNQYTSYVAALSHEPASEASQKEINEWLGSSQQTAQELETLLGTVSQFTASAEHRKEITDKIVNGGKGVALMLMLLALAVGATGLSSMDHA